MAVQGYTRSGWGEHGWGVGDLGAPGWPAGVGVGCGLSPCRPFPPHGWSAAGGHPLLLRKQPIWAAGGTPHLMPVEQGLPWHPVVMGLAGQAIPCVVAAPHALPSSTFWFPVPAVLAASPASLPPSSLSAALALVPPGVAPAFCMAVFLLPPSIGAPGRPLRTHSCPIPPPPSPPQPTRGNPRSVGLDPPGLHYLGAQRAFRGLWHGMDGVLVPSTGRAPPHMQTCYSTKGRKYIHFSAISFDRKWFLHEPFVPPVPHFTGPGVASRQSIAHRFGNTQGHTPPASQSQAPKIQLPTDLQIYCDQNQQISRKFCYIFVTFEPLNATVISHFASIFVFAFAVEPPYSTL